MWMLLLALSLVEPVGDASATETSDHDMTCSVNVRVSDDGGRMRPVRRVSASAVSAVVFEGRVAPADDETPQLLFDVFTPRGQRYQVLQAKPRVVTSERNRHRIPRTTRTLEAGLAVGGSSIAWTSMYGKWRVEPRIEGTEQPCGKAEFFTIRP